jgi:hypothetical protein
MSRLLVFGSESDRALSTPVAAGDDARIWSGNPDDGTAMSVGAVAAVALGDVLVEAPPGVPLVRWLAGERTTGRTAEPTASRVIAQTGPGLWRRAPWPVNDELFRLPPPAGSATCLVVSADVQRRARVLDGLRGRSVRGRGVDHLQAADLASCRTVVLLGAPGPLPAWLMAPLAARRVLIIAGAGADFGLQADVDHLAAFDDDEAVALAGAVQAQPEAFAAVQAFGRVAAQHHRATAVFDRMLVDLEMEGALTAP